MRALNLFLKTLYTLAIIGALGFGAAEALTPAKARMGTCDGCFLQGRDAKCESSECCGKIGSICLGDENFSDCLCA